jgi:hypothetical protein
MERSISPEKDLIAEGTQTKQDDLISLRDLSNLSGVPAEALAVALETQRQRIAAHQEFFTVRQLSAKWQVSPGQVRNILKDYFFKHSNAKILNMGNGGKRKKPLVPAETVGQIEKSREEKFF